MKSCSKSLFFKRATFTVALFFAHFAVASSRETYRDIIEKSYNLSLQKDRTQAVSILLSALKRESKKSTAQRELAAALEKVSEVFFSDKAQQLFELALSLRISDPASAQSKLQEAARLEPENISIEIAIARQSLAANECDNAYSKIQKYRELSPYIDELKLVIAQSLVCQGKMDEYLNLKSAADAKTLKLSIFWQETEVEYLFKTGSLAKSRDLILTVQKKDAAFAEAYFWQWKIEQQMKLKSDIAAHKYISLCKMLNSRQERQYLAEPRLCRHTSEVETFLKNNNNSEI